MLEFLSASLEEAVKRMDVKDIKIRHDAIGNINTIEVKYVPKDKSKK